MARLSKQKTKQHERVMNEHIEHDKPLTQDDILDVFKHWTPEYGGHIVQNAAFFTPLRVAQTLIGMTTNVEGVLLDLCAGIGSLVYAMKVSSWWRWDLVDEVYALEYEPEYVRVGKRLFPEVNWIQGDMFDLDLLRSIGRIDSVVSNPPYNNVKTTNNKADWLSYKGVAHLMAVEIAMRMADRGAGFILPQNDLPFTFTNNSKMEYMYTIGKRKIYGHTGSKHKYVPEDKQSQDCQRFLQANPHIALRSVAVDMSYYEWDDAPAVELVNVTAEPWNAEMHLPATQLSLAL